MSACSISSVHYTAGDLDVPDGAILLRETADDTIVPGASATCGAADMHTTVANTWYRAFVPTSFGIASAFHVTNVRFATEMATASKPVTIAISSYAGPPDEATLDETAMTTLDEVALEVDDAATLTLQTVSMNATIDTGGVIVVSVSTPIQNFGSGYRLGATTSGQTHPGYLKAIGCNVLVPTDTQTARSSSGEIIIEAIGMPE